MTKNKARTTKNSGVRIISGQWRGRVLPVLAEAGLRPSGDRTRETVFNWLQFELADQRCLDLCAGTGALGFEALSRGAKHCDFVEPNTITAQQLNANACLLSATNTAIHGICAQQYLSAYTGEPYSVIFIDPPFDLKLWQTLISQLSKPTHLNNEALIYVECPRDATFDIPSTWTRIKTKTVGQVSISLYQYTTAAK